MIAAAVKIEFESVGGAQRPRRRGPHHLSGAAPASAGRARARHSRVPSLDPGALARRADGQHRRLHARAGWPGVVLVCHDAIYSLDTGGGELGLLYSRRRETHPSVQGIASLDDRLTSVFRRALSVCARLEREHDLAGLSFPGERFELAINDRRVTAAATGELAQALELVSGWLFAGERRASRSAAATAARASRRRCAGNARRASASCWRGSTWAWRRGCRERRGDHRPARCGSSARGRANRMSGPYAPLA